MTIEIVAWWIRQNKKHGFAGHFYQVFWQVNCLQVAELWHSGPPDVLKAFYILWIAYLAYFSVYFQKLLSKLLWPLLNNHLFRSVSFTMSFDQLLRQIWPCITVLMYWTQTIVYILVKSSIHLLQWIDKRDSRYHSLTRVYSVVLASIYELLNIYSSYFREEKNWGSMADWHWLMNWVSNTYQFSWLIWH